MKGKLYGIGTGPGDPDLITLKAVKTIEKCDVIAVPSALQSEKTAFNIVEKYLENKQIIQCHFSMEKDEEKRKEKRLKIAEEICATLEEGKDIGFITLGEPTIYSTYMYIHAEIKKRGFDTEIISGIPSFVAVASALDKSLCEGDEILHIIPATNEKNINEIKNLKGNKVIMKSGKNITEVLQTLKGMGMDAKIVSRCTMTDQKIFNSISEYENENNPEYFSVIIVKE